VTQGGDFLDIANTGLDQVASYLVFSSRAVGYPITSEIKISANSFIAVEFS
jgi:hypothetical protein